jgi:hypothetical protein
MKTSITSALLGMGLALSSSIQAGPQGFGPVHFLDWGAEQPAQTLPESSQQTRPDEDGSADQITEIAMNRLHPKLSPRLAALQPGEPLLQDIQIRDERPLSPDPEALADMEYHALAEPGPVQEETGGTNIAVAWKNLFD